MNFNFKSGHTGTGRIVFTIFSNPEVTSGILMKLSRPIQPGFKHLAGGIPSMGILKWDCFSQNQQMAL